MMATMMVTTTAAITKTKTMTGTTLIKYQTMMKVVPNHMMILTMVTNPRIAVKIIITQKMRMIMMITVVYLKMMIKIQMILIDQRNLQVKTEEETDVVVIIPYPEEMAG